MSNLTEQLKNYFATATKESLEKDFFNIECVIRGIDPESPDARKQLKKEKRLEKWSMIKPTLILAKDIFVTSMLYMGAGMSLIQEKYWLFALNIFLGMYFMFKTLNSSKKTW